MVVLLVVFLCFCGGVFVVVFLWWCLRGTHRAHTCCSHMECSHIECLHRVSHIECSHRVVAHRVLTYSAHMERSHIHCISFLFLHCLGSLAGIIYSCLAYIE